MWACEKGSFHDEMIFRLEAFEWPEVLFLNSAFKKPVVS